MSWDIELWQGLSRYSKVLRCMCCDVFDFSKRDLSHLPSRTGLICLKRQSWNFLPSQNGRFCTRMGFPESHNPFCLTKWNHYDPSLSNVMIVLAAFTKIYIPPTWVLETRCVSSGGAPINFSATPSFLKSSVSRNSSHQPLTQRPPISITAFCG